MMAATTIAAILRGHGLDPPPGDAGPDALDVLIGRS
jgi:hypothetical protein